MRIQLGLTFNLKVIKRIWDCVIPTFKAINLSAYIASLSILLKQIKDGGGQFLLCCATLARRGHFINVGLQNAVNPKVHIIISIINTTTTQRVHRHIQCTYSFNKTDNINLLCTHKMCILCTPHNFADHNKTTWNSAKRDMSMSDPFAHCWQLINI